MNDLNFSPFDAIGYSFHRKSCFLHSQRFCHQNPEALHCCCAISWNGQGCAIRAINSLSRSFIPAAFIFSVLQPHKGMSAAAHSDWRSGSELAAMVGSQCPWGNGCLWGKLGMVVFIPWVSLFEGRMHFQIEMGRICPFSGISVQPWPTSESLCKHLAHPFSAFSSQQKPEELGLREPPHLPSPLLSLGRHYLTQNQIVQHNTLHSATPSKAELLPGSPPWANTGLQSTPGSGFHLTEHQKSVQKAHISEEQTQWRCAGIDVINITKDFGTKIQNMKVCKRLFLKKITVEIIWGMKKMDLQVPLSKETTAKDIGDF